MEYLGGAGLGRNVNPMVLSLIYHIFIYDIFWVSHAHRIE